MFGFLKRNKEIKVIAPIEGTVIDLSEVSDPVFADKMVGDGVAIEPSGGNVVSPVKGKVMQVFPTKHAIGIETEEGVELLIHIGIETVKLNGEGFKQLIEEGSKVEAGTPLMEVDWEYLKSQGKSTVTPIVITDSKSYEINQRNIGKATKGETNIIILNKN